MDFSLARTHIQLPGWAQRIREHFPLTIQGTLALVLTLLALQIFGYGNMDLVIFAISICALAIVCFSLISIVATSFIYRNRIRRFLADTRPSRKPAILEAGYPNETGFTLNELHFAPLVKVTWSVVFPGAIKTRVRQDFETGELKEEIIPQRRCHTSLIVRAFTVTDVLGFCRFSWRQGQEIPMTILPQTNTVKSLPILRSLTAEDGIPNPSGSPEGDRMEIRPYVPGDSVRNIMWKTFAKSRQLNVRLAEKSVFQSTRTLAYLLSGKNDEAAAAVARTALESGALGDEWIFSADGTETGCTELDPALLAIAKSRSLLEPLEYGLDNFLRRYGSQGDSRCIIFAAAENAPWINKLNTTHSLFRGKFTLIMATDGFLYTHQKRSPMQFLLKRPENLASKSNQQTNFVTGITMGKKELGSLLTKLSQLVESLFVIDRSTGTSYDYRLRKI